MDHNARDNAISAGPTLEPDQSPAANGARNVRRDHPPTLRLYRPNRTLPVSVTGTDCALRCAHCGGHYLQHMQPIDGVDPGDAKSLLISGGCDRYGRVPVDTHLDAIRRLGEGRRVNAHLGLVDEATMRVVAPLVDVVSCDVVGDRETAREVYGLDLCLEECVATLRMIRRFARVVPHLTLGLRGGEFSGERAALAALAAEGVDALVLLVLIPTAGTAFAGCTPPAVDEVAAHLAMARTLLPHAEITLGCMRPYGAYRQAVDEAAVRAGLNGIVNPTRRAERVARALGLEIVWGDECCALS